MRKFGTITDADASLTLGVKKMLNQPCFWSKHFYSLHLFDYVQWPIQDSPEGTPTAMMGASTYYFGQFPPKTARKWTNLDPVGERSWCPLDPPMMHRLAFVICERLLSRMINNRVKFHEITNSKNEHRFSNYIQTIRLIGFNFCKLR